MSEEGSIKVDNQIVASSSADHSSAAAEPSNLGFVRSISNYIAISITADALAIEETVNRNCIVGLRVRPHDETVSALRESCESGSVILENNVSEISFGVKYLSGVNNLDVC